MADDVLIKNGTGAGVDFTAATDEIGGKHYPRVKVGHGADGSYSDASASAPLPVTPAGTGTGALGAQTAVSSSAVQVAAADSARKSLILQNVGSGDVRVAASGSVTATTGVKLASPLGWISLSAINGDDVQGAWYAIRDGSVDSIILAQKLG